MYICVDIGQKNNEMVGENVEEKKQKYRSRPRALFQGICIFRRKFNIVFLFPRITFHLGCFFHSPDSPHTRECNLEMFNVCGYGVELVGRGQNYFRVFVQIKKGLGIFKRSLVIRIFISFFVL